MKVKEVKKAGYKMTKLGWVPEEWEVVRFSDVAAINMGQSPNGKSYNQIGVGMPLINGPSEFTDKYPIKKQWTSSPTKMCKKGDILLCVRGSSTGRINISNEKYCIGRGVAAIRANHYHNHTYIEYQLRNAVDRILRLTTGSTFPNIDSKSLRGILVKIPPLPEQKKIATILSTWDEAIENVQKTIEQLELRKKGLMQRLLTGKVRVKGFGGAWEEVRLGDIGDFKTSSVDKKIRENQKIINLINYMNVYKHQKITTENTKILMKVSANESQISGSNLEKGDILFTPSSETPRDIGHSIVIFENLKNTLYSYHLIRFRPRIKLDLLYSHYFCNTTSILNQFSKFATGSTRFTISVGNFSKVKLKIPPLPEQTAIATILSTADEEISINEQKLEALKAQKKGLMQQLLTGKIRVKA